MKRQGISSIDQWNTAFTIFMSVYLTKFPLEAKAILKYSETVNVLQKKGGNFLAFDDNVRYLRQCKLSAWDSFHTEQYVEAMTPSKQPTSSTPSPTGRQIPRGFCFEHHEGRLCPGCRHNHKCPWCWDLTLPPSVRVPKVGNQTHADLLSSSLFVDSMPILGILWQPAYSTTVPHSVVRICTNTSMVSH